MRHFARLDRNHNEIVKAFRSLGCTVQSLATLGKGCPDLLCGLPGNVNILVEVKDGNADLTPDQVVWHSKWINPVHIIRNIGEVVAVVNAYRRKPC